jgi:hypothetical protein
MYTNLYLNTLTYIYMNTHRSVTTLKSNQLRIKHLPMMKIYHYLHLRNHLLIMDNLNMSMNLMSNLLSRKQLIMMRKNSQLRINYLPMMKIFHYQRLRNHLLIMDNLNMSIPLMSNLSSRKQLIMMLKNNQLRMKIKYLPMMKIFHYQHLRNHLLMMGINLNMSILLMSNQLSQKQLITIGKNNQ